jgi:phosphohistidine phosphatase SixA
MTGWSVRISRITQCATVLFLLGAPGPLLAGQLAGDTSPKLSGPALVQELQKGGYVIYFRHGTTSNFGEKDVADSELADCALQRNLSDAGQAQTRAIGAAFTTLQIPIGEVDASPYCRCLDTARNIFGKAAESKALHFAIHLRHLDRVRVTQELLDRLATRPSAGTNTAMVSHTANLQEAVGIWPKPEGVAHIFKPLSDGTFSYVGVMQPEAWQVEAARFAGQRPWGGGWLSALTQWLWNLR